jgi:hypothetical protein
MPTPSLGTETLVATKNFAESRTPKPEAIGELPRFIKWFADITALASKLPVVGQQSSYAS